MIHLQIAKNALLIPRMTDMHNGTYRPEVVVDCPGTGGNIVFLPPVASLDEAGQRAWAVIDAATAAHRLGLKPDRVEELLLEARAR